MIKKYIDDILNKKFIKFNFFEYVASILIIKKLKNNLKICNNYKIFNALTIKNKNVFFLIKKTLIKLYLTKIYNKFDIIIAFNEMRIKKNEKKKQHF